jgi:hypothetical protein
MDPYKVLGLAYGATMQEVKVQYMKLAKAHHPDKLHGVSEEEKKAHEDIFKKVTCAYRAIEELQSSKGPTDEGYNGLWESHGWSDWATVWKTVFKDTMTEMRRRLHVIKVPVTLEDVHECRKKKLEVFLRDIAEPIYIRVDCGLWPKTSIVTDDGYIIKVRFILLEHKVYHLDNLLGTVDLYTDCDITWCEYLSGLNTHIQWCDAKTTINIVVPAFCNLDIPLMFSNKGLWGKGALYVRMRLIPPIENKWQQLETEKKNLVIAALDAARP